MTEPSQDTQDISAGDVLAYIRLNHPEIVAQAIKHWQRANELTTEELFNERE